ncbi:hypothetical protein [Vulcanisaeta souniana]|uniref:Uncharacterized protein n=1 Tax=Vulcanisaeta souniana JCM 11219 TaxID=1293586 RepID=A0A830EAF6_9CREN|nr:hypothetical protein [Vulcanisaeta souniana]BDR91289.1 hypothetical protein Vsou_03820 [Vulcanisaeta souniana JCM 11219]GGI84842.1 hypothetical protein GCM10007112_22250 [Vulcanisaeta souniana JCM 11219]
MSLDSLERGIEYIRWSLFIVSADASTLVLLLLLSLFVSSFAAYIFTVVLAYFLLVSTVVPYVIIAILWLLGFRNLARYSRRYFIGFIGSLITVVSYFMNVTYMGYLIINELVGNTLVPQPLFLEPIILAYSRYFIVFSLYLPLPLFASFILGIIGSILSMLVLYRLGNDFNSPGSRRSALVSIIGLLAMEFPLVGGLLISIGSAFLAINLGSIKT